MHMFWAAQVMQNTNAAVVIPMKLHAIGTRGHFTPLRAIRYHCYHWFLI